VVLILLAIDLGVFHRKHHAINVREALLWSGIWLAVAAIFNFLIYFGMGSEQAMDFAAGYLIERSLSLDNLFVFIFIFSYFKVPSQYQYKALFWGILAALILRGIFVMAGIELISTFHWIIYVFGAFLIITGLKIMLSTKEKDVDLGRNPGLLICKKFLPMTEHYGDGRFFVRIAGKLLATPLFLVLVVVEITDIIFALDSVPAVLGITLDPFVVYTSNVFSILGLRALYFAVAGGLLIFGYLNYGITLILIFIGLKMLLSSFYEIPASFALSVIVMILAISIGLSICLNPSQRSHGSQIWSSCIYYFFLGISWISKGNKMMADLFGDTKNLLIKLSGGRQ
jgi:tellurite resistance protein TerC